MKDIEPSIITSKSANSLVIKLPEKRMKVFGKDPQVNPEQPLGKLKDELEFKWGEL